jgi:hypothetical protein
MANDQCNRAAIGFDDHGCILELRDTNALSQLVLPKVRRPSFHLWFFDLYLDLFGMYYFKRTSFRFGFCQAIEAFHIEIFYLCYRDTVAFFHWALILYVHLVQACNMWFQGTPFDIGLTQPNQR